MTPSSRCRLAGTSFSRPNPSWAGVSRNALGRFRAGRGMVFQPAGRRKKPDASVALRPGRLVAGDRFDLAEHFGRQLVAGIEGLEVVLELAEFGGAEDDRRDVRVGEAPVERHV